MEKDSEGFYSPVTDSKAEIPSEQDDKTDLVKSTFDVTVTVGDQQLDPNSPLYSVKTFEELGLNEELLKGIYKMGFSKPSKIQERALPLLLQDPPQHMIGQSQSGTGKTAAFVLAMLSRIDYSKNETQAICLAPSRELARQIMSVVTTMGKFTGVITEYAIPDQLPRDVTRVTAHIIVGTPGTTGNLIARSVINPSTVKIFVLDEADTMVDTLSLGPQVLKVKRGLPKNCQLVLFSATFSDQVRAHVNKLAPGANKIELKRNEIAVDTITQFYLDCVNEDAKYDALVGLYHLMTIGQSIIFCKAKVTADKIADRMRREGHKVASLHGSKEAADRDSIMDRFRSSQDKVLITTNVVARGIDIPQVNMVVNYDLPMMSERQKEPGVNDRLDLVPDVETYIHRIGRTGRFGRKGVSVNFVHNDKTFQNMMTIQQEIGTTIVKVDTRDYDMMEEQLKKIEKKNKIVEVVHETGNESIDVSSGKKDTVS